MNELYYIRALCFRNIVSQLGSKVLAFTSPIIVKNLTHNVIRDLCPRLVKSASENLFFANRSC